MDRSLLAVHAHPDDECIGTGGILARYAAEGVRTILVTCTDGAVGEISDPALATPDNLAEVRARELDASVVILGVRRLVKLGYRDSGMAGTADNNHPASFQQANLDEAIERVVEVIRTEHPQVVVTYDERGGYGHPDHIRAHQVAVAAFEAAGDPQRYPSAGPVWAPAKLYYAVFPRSAMQTFGERLRAAGIETPFDTPAEGGDVEPSETPFGVSDDRVTTTVDVSAYVADKRAALVSHATQMGPEQFFMRLPQPLFAEAFGRETFQRVAGPGDTPEDDLFSGL
ncbi:MAG TPA: N-acetyl-1-D-myo-inositol-2-amino-2-deoxy-alpha-D-glucopyranoside deacetylase [Chloroflexota bacterium]|nr:N-acetyl-1-D-myo-inositol-2-amino-2-deoxy-alpha-D-glucopyranoside deacetylase [Chloroflexota bacterium]